ncbi:hypothetical protein B0H21DRAFT_884149 [Amylocystis lapponica]|nr:hypothetical protein B0H21DRAFT_884149 [Amylocystis lapponica]
MPVKLENHLQAACTMATPTDPIRHYDRQPKKSLNREPTSRMIMGALASATPIWMSLQVRRRRRTYERDESEGVDHRQARFDSTSTTTMPPTMTTTSIATTTTTGWRRVRVRVEEAPRYGSAQYGAGPGAGLFAALGISTCLCMWVERPADRETSVRRTLFQCILSAVCAY